LGEIMARPLSDHAKRLQDYFNAGPATLAAAAHDLGLDYSQSKLLVGRLVYARRLLVLRKERMFHCKKPVALYAGPEYVKVMREAA
jgi:hypothetical protein